MQTTNISWADYSWNPITGCSHAGPECWNCYAETFSLRQGRTEAEWTVENAGENVSQHPDRLAEPFTYHYPEGEGRVFVGSMTDMFHSEADPWFVQLSLDACRHHPEHVWIYLTKRPQHAAAWDLDWPENVWLGTSVGSGPGGDFPNTTHRIEQLRDVDVATKWVSFEPLIEPIGDVALDHVDWMVVGGESGEDNVRREMEHEWARDLKRQARQQDVAYFFKQSSGRYPETGPELTVERMYDEMIVYEQQEFREFPELPTVTKRARDHAPATGNNQTTRGP